MRDGASPREPAGIIRPARRPEGWRAPGPPPTGPVRPPGPLEDLCYLLGDWRIYQRVDGHRWSLDDLLVAAVASGVVPAPGTRTDRAAPRSVLDLGCGIGSVLLMLAWRYPQASLLGVEAQTISVDLCRRSIALNGVSDRVEVREADLRAPTWNPEALRFPLVTGTPPYFAERDGVVSDRPQRGPCRFELRGGIEAYFEAAQRALSPGGTFVVCEDARQRPRVEAAAARGGLTIQAVLEVVPKAGKAPLFSVFTCRSPPARGATRGRDPRESRLVIRDEQGQRTSDFRRLREAMGLPH